MALSTNDSNEIFNRIAFRYDLVNTVLSFGFQQAWRERLVKSFPSDIRTVLDLACGTGSIPLAFLKYRPDVTNITGIDIAENMLSVGRTRLQKAGASDRVQLFKGDALDPQFETGSFDAVTAGFALRNVPDVMKFVSSAYRVLKPSGHFRTLEFSRPDRIIPALFYRFFLGVLVPFIGFLSTGNWVAYRHLGKSILLFPDKKRFLKMLRQAGFRNIVFRSMAFGAVTLYITQK